MPMIDVYAVEGTFADTHALAVALATAVKEIEQVPDIAMFRKNTAAFVHDLPPNALANVDGDNTYVRVQVLTNAGALDREKQLAVVAKLTDLVVDAAGDDQLRDLDFLDRGDDTSPSGLTDRFISMWRAVLEGSDFEAGCAVLAVAVTADEPDLNATAGSIFRSWRAHLSDRSSAAGVSAELSAQFAATLIAAIEGAVVLSRAEASIEPFDLVAVHLMEAAARLV